MHEPDIRLLRAAYGEALKAAGNSDPNPAVGALVTDDAGNIIARGFTQRAGHAHAERMALQNLGAEAEGKTLYVTLEPCCHQGRTPPCTDIIVDKRIRRVVVGERDFAAEVMGKSVDLLRQQGITVELLPENLLVREKFFTTGPFFHAREKQRPRVTLKWAQTFDGALAPPAGVSGKISGDAAAALTAALRNYCKFTLASPGTVRSDQPRLDVRFPSNAADWRARGFSDFFVQLISAQLTPPAVSDPATRYKVPARGYLAYPMEAAKRAGILDMQKAIAPDFFLFERSAADLHTVFTQSMLSLLQEILARGFNSLLIEAGPNFSQSLLASGLVDLLVVYQAKFRTAQHVWGAQGRGNAASMLIAGAAKDAPQLPGFTLIERGDLDSDVAYVFQHTVYA